MSEPDSRRGLDDGLWLGDEETPTQSHRRGSRWRRFGTVAAAVACLAVVGVPTGLVLTSGGGAVVASPTKTHRGPGDNAPAERRVLAALSATTDSDSFDVTYQFEAPTASTTPTTTVPCPTQLPSAMRFGPTGTSKLSVGSTGTGTGKGTAKGTGTGHGTGTTATCGGHSRGMSVAGHGTIDTDPYAMVATTDVNSLGEITIRTDGTDIWELGGGDYGLSPGSTDKGPGSVLSGFANLVEGTLGPRQGAFAMMGLASPTGYLELDQDEITGADQTGTGTVDGTAVSVYRVTLNPAEEVDVPGITPVEATTINDALAVLKKVGYTGSNVQVSIDGSGYIRQVIETAEFSDGSTVVSEGTFSDFGCAGKVLMPGQQGTATPPAGCVSPDTGVAPAARPTAVAPTTEPSTTVPPTTVPSTTMPPTTVPPTTVPPTTVPSTTVPSTTVPSTTVPSSANTGR